MSQDKTDSGQSEIEKVSNDGDVPKLTVNKVGPQATHQPIRPEPREFKPSSVELLEQEVIPVEQVNRLDQSEPVERKKPGQVKFEKRKEKPTQEVQQEEQWGKGAVVFRWWFLLGGVALVAVIASAVVFSTYIEGRAMEEVETPDIEIIESDPYEGNPEQWFRKRNVILEKQALELAGQYISSDSFKEKSKFVRRPDEYLQYASMWSLDVTARLEGNNTWRISHTVDTAFLILNTVDKDFFPISLYFVRKGEQLKLDWFASVAWSKLTVKKVKEALDSKTANSQLSLEDTMTLRCLLRRKDEFYAGPYNDKDHAVFMILSPDKEDYLWGYVERDSGLDKKLRKLLDHGRFVVSLKKDVRVTLRIRKGKKDALPLQMELVELTHSEWVKPRGQL